jgi:hypothetical protein
MLQYDAFIEHLWINFGYRHDKDSTRVLGFKHRFNIITSSADMQKRI